MTEPLKKPKYDRLTYNREYMRKYRKENPEKAKEYQRLYMQQIRIEVLKELGGVCRICSFSDVRALQIDHVNGDGAEDRRKMRGRKYLLFVLDSVKNKENRYQLLCANCNWIKRVENEECN